MGIEQTIKLGVDVDIKNGLKSADQLGKAFTSAVNPKSTYSGGSAAKATAEKASGMGETKTARSVGGNAGTGSASSDFAAQAQGLGGLVHVYATFAANIFAVSAAFNALSKAMDVTNLVKGLDQIGASTGKNLGSLAKQMVAVSDGAISMQQAMSSTAMASAGGMTNQAILRMTEVAKKASLALGRDMTDSMDRITKGIIKTQPELLDELGIMTRVIPAQQEYARSIGKTAASLTDFEKRQAFANAVLAEGERKFGAIAMDANPYSKILASTNNLIQSGLELINKVLAPLLNLLSSSPTGLAVALGGIAAMLMKQAIPAIGMFRENAKLMEKETHDRVTRQVKEQQAAAIASDAIIAAKASREYQVSEASARAIADLPKRFSKKIVGNEVRGLLAKSPYDLSEADMALIKSKQEQLATSTDERHKKEAENIKKRYDGNLAIQKAALDAGYNATVVQIDKDEKAWTHASMKKRELDKLTRKAAVSSILSNTADTAAIQGPSIAFKQLREQTSALDAGKITKYATVVKGSFSIITSAMGTAVSAFGIWGQLIGLALAGLAMFDSWVTKSAKESEAFSSSLETLNSSFANVDRTIEVISKKGALDFLSVESTQAKANALNDLTGNLTDVVAKFAKLQDAQNGWDQFFDGFWDMFGKGSGDKLALGVSNSVISSLKLMREGPAKEEAKKSIQALFNTKVDLSSVKAFNASIKDLDKTEIQEKAQALEKMLSTASREANNAASAMTGFKTALTDIGRQSTSMSNAILPKDEFSKMGMELAKGSNQMAEALKDPINGLTILRELAGDIKTLSFLPPDVAKKLGGAKVEMDRLATSIATLEKELSDSEDKKSKYSSEYTAANKSRNTDRTSQGFKQLKDNLELEQKRSAEVRARLNDEETRAKNLQALYASVPDLLNKASVDLLTKGLTAALNEASVVAAKGYISVLNAAGIGTATETAAADQQAISGQMELVKANYANVQSQEGLKVSIDALTLTNERAILEDKLNNAKSIAEATSISKELSVNASKFADVVKRGNILSNSRETNLKLFKNKNAEGTTLEDKQAMEQMTTYMYSLIGSEQQLAKLRAQSGAVELTKKVGLIAEEVKHSKELLAIDSKKLTIEKDAIDLAIQASGSYSSVLRDKKEEVEAGLAQVAGAQTLLPILQKMATIDLAISTGGKTTKTTEARLEAEKELDVELKSIAAKRDAADLSNLKTRQAGSESLRQTEQDNNVRNLKEVEAISNAYIVSAEDRLNYLNSIGSIEAADLITEKAKLDIKKQQSSYAVEEANITAAGATNLIRLQNELNIAKLTPGADTTGIQSKIDAEVASILKQREVLDIINAARLRGIELTAEQAKHTAIQADHMTKMQSITESLTTAFGEMGASIGKVGEALLSSAQSMENLAKREKELKDSGKGEDSTEFKKLQSDKTKAELDSITKVSGATKKMFGEKTAAYKILDTVEKVSAVAKTALLAKELALELGLITATATKTAVVVGSAGVENAAELSKAPIKGTNAILSALEAPFPINFAAGAAMAAIVTSLLGGGGSEFTMPGGITSADMQETQGTGLSYDANGNKVANGGGVFGDTSAKSETIQKSLDLIAATSVAGMSYFDEQVHLLTKINDGIGNLAISLFSQAGIVDGTIGGIVEGSSSSGGWLFGSSSTDTAIIDSGVQLKGTFMDLANAGTSAAASISKYATVQTTSSSSGFLGGIFGGSSSTSINKTFETLDQDVREQVGGIFSGAIDLFKEQGTKLGVAEGYVVATLETIDVDKFASLRGLKGADLQKELNAVIGGIMDDAAKDLFPKLGVFKKFNEGYSETVTRVLDTNKKINDAFKQFGTPLLKLTEVASKATTQMKLDLRAAQDSLAAAKANLAAFKPIESTESTGYEGTVKVYSKPDAATTDAVTRAEETLLAVRKKVEEAEKGMTVNNLALTESLANAAGGLDKFLELTSSFTDKYLNLAEQVGPKMAAQAEEMTRLGLATDTTKEQLKQYILNFKLVQEANSEVSQDKADEYVALLKLAEAYDTNRTALLALADSYGIGENAIKKILDGAMDASIDASGTGYDIANELLYSIQSAMYEQASTQISAMMFDTVVSPIINSMLAGTFAVDIMNGTFDTMLTKATTMADNIAAAFSNPDLVAALDLITTKLGSAVGIVVTTFKGVPSLSSGTSGGRPANVAKTTTDTPKLMTAEELRKALVAQEIELLNAQNKTYKALQLTRKEEIFLLEQEVIAGTKSRDQADQLISGKQAIYAAQDLAKTTQLNTDLMTVQGRTSEVLAITRQKELLALSGTDAAIKKEIYAREDANKTQQLSVELMRALNMESESLVITRQNELAALSATDQAIKKNLYGVQDAVMNTDKAYAALERAVNKQKSDISKLITEQEKAKQTASDLVDTVTAVFDLLKDQVDELYGTVSSTALMNAEQGQNFITEALITAQNTGTMPALDDLTKAISSVRKSFEDTGFSTAFEADKANLLLANKLDALKGLSASSLTKAKTQMSLAEDQLVKLGDQLTALDTLLEEQKNLVNVARGIDVSVGKVSDAIDGLAKALSVETGLSTALKTPDVKGINGASYNTKLGVGTNTAGQTFSGSAMLDIAKTMYAANPTTDTAKTILDQALGNMGSVANVAKVLGYTEQNIIDFATANNYKLPGYAEGGYHTGGLRLVGENGPELEVTQPSMIYNAANTSKMLNGNSDEMAAEIKLLRQQLTSQNEFITYINERMVKIFDRWDMNGMPETRAA